MKRQRTPEEIGTLNIEMAARHGKPGPSPGSIGAPHLLHIPATRDVPLPEPVATGWLNGRPPGGWPTRFSFCWFPPADGGHEEAAIRSARERERRLEAALLAGTMGQP